MLGDLRRGLRLPEDSPVVPASRRSARELGRQLLLSLAPRRIAVTFSPTFDEASLIGEERRNVGRPLARPAFTGGQPVGKS